MSIMSDFTNRSLKKNKTRTIVTIIGIILSLSMFTAVTSSVVSLQNFIINLTKADTGDWHGAINYLSNDKIVELQESSEVEKLSILQGIGFADLPQSVNPDKQFLHVSQVNEAFLANMAVNVVEGRLPTNENEIIVNKQVNSNAQVGYEIGDIITLDLGTLQYEEKFTMVDNFPAIGSILDEKINVQQRTFTIVGFMEVPMYEKYNSPGFSAITLGYNQATQANAFFTLKEPRNIYDFLEKNYASEVFQTNSELLRYMGISGIDAFHSVLWSMGAILIGIIMFGSISLIYNSFSISVSDRTKNFGLLKSIGATKRQISNSVLYEATVLSVIGIPLGIIAGLAGIGVTLKVLESTFDKIINVNTDVALTLSIQWEAIIIAAIIGYITVLISAYIPARRASKLNVISSIRQTNDIKLTSKQVRVSPLTKWLFGFEGTLASKYFKRNKKSYRATVLSIFMSIVLFISASSLTGYLTSTSEDLITNIKHDITYSYYNHMDTDKDYTLGDIENLFATEQSVTNFSYYAFESLEVTLPTQLYDKKYIEYVDEELTGAYNEDKTSITSHAIFYFLDDESYKSYVKVHNLNEEVYLSNNPAPLVFDDNFKIFSSKQEKYLAFDLLDNNTGTMKYDLPKEIEGYQFIHTEFKDGQKYALYYSTDELGYREDAYGNREYFIDENMSSSSKLFLASEVLEEKSIQYFDVLEELPFGAYPATLALVYPMSAYSDILGLPEKSMPKDIEFYLATNTPYETYETLNNVLVENNWDNHRLHNIHEESDAVNALLTIINTFCYGFIVLISLIALANIFNTISTNIYLRRREFAMLRSVGMTIKGIQKMLNLECLLYGIKGLLYGIPVSLGVSYLIYKSMNTGLNVEYFIPWTSFAIAIVSVFVFVFGTMLYAMKQVKKDNPMETLRNDNL